MTVPSGPSTRGHLGSAQVPERSFERNIQYSTGEIVRLTRNNLWTKCNQDLTNKWYVTGDWPDGMLLTLIQKPAATAEWWESSLGLSQFDMGTNDAEFFEPVPLHVANQGYTDGDNWICVIPGVTTSLNGQFGPDAAYIAQAQQFSVLVHLAFNTADNHMYLNIRTMEYNAGVGASQTPDGLYWIFLSKRPGIYIDPNVPFN